MSRDKPLTEQDRRALLEKLNKVGPPDTMSLGVTTENGKVRVEFGKAVTYLTMTPDQAGGFAAMLTQMALRAEEEAKGGKA